MTTRHMKPSGKQIYETLRTQILTLELDPGSSLDEFSLADTFGVSRSPIRNVIARLSAEGLVTTIGNRSKVSRLMSYEAFPRYVDALDLLQRAVTRLAAREAGAAEIARIRKANDAYLEAVHAADPAVMFEANKTFHLAIADAANNPFMARHYATLLDENQRLLHVQFDFIATEFGRSLGDDHEAMIAAIAKGDEHRAEAAAHEHTLLFRDRFLRYLKQQRATDIAIEFPPKTQGDHHE